MQRTALSSLRDFLYARFSKKCFTYGDEMLFTCWGTSEDTDMAAGNQQKHPSLSFVTKELVNHAYSKNP